MLKDFFDPAESWDVGNDCTDGLAHEIADLATKDIEVREPIKSIYNLM